MITAAKQNPWTNYIEFEAEFVGVPVALDQFKTANGVYARLHGNQYVHVIRTIDGKVEWELKLTTDEELRRLPQLLAKKFADEAPDSINEPSEDCVKTEFMRIFDKCRRLGIVGQTRH